MKVACGYTIPITKYGLPPSLENHLKAMEEVKESGFSALEMELVAGEKEYITNWGRVIQKSKDLSLDVPSIMAVTYDMFSLDNQKQKESIRHFAEICTMTRDIGAKMVTNCFYLPPELVPEDKTELYHGGCGQGVKNKFCGSTRFHPCRACYYFRTNNRIYDYFGRYVPSRFRSTGNKDCPCTYLFSSA